MPFCATNRAYKNIASIKTMRYEQCSLTGGQKVESLIPIRFDKMAIKLILNVLAWFNLTYFLVKFFFKHTSFHIL
jgi:hypothetical protein